jgi:hypothetical protein
MHEFPKFTPAWNSTCFGQFLCPSSGVYSLYTWYWCMSSRFVDSFRARPEWSRSKAVYKPVWHIPVPSVEWIYSWWWAEELSEKCKFSCRSKFGKLMHLVGFIIKKLYHSLFLHILFYFIPFHFLVDIFRGKMNLQWHVYCNILLFLKYLVFLTSVYVRLGRNIAENVIKLLFTCFRTFCDNTRSHIQKLCCIYNSKRKTAAKLPTYGRKCQFFNLRTSKFDCSNKSFS